MQSALPAAPPADAPVDEDIGPELEGEEFAGMGMVTAIAEGLLPSPGVLRWNEWQRWRARSGRRPQPPARRDARFPLFQRRELNLWRATTQLALALAEGLEETPGAEEVGQDDGAAEEAPLPAAEGEEVPPGLGSLALRAVGAPAPEAREDASDLSSVAWTEGSWKGLSSEELRSRLLTDFDPASETLQTFESRVYRAVSLLEARGEDPGASVVQRAVLRARYSMETAGMAPLEAGRFYKKTLAALLDSDDTDELQEQRAQVLVELAGECGGGGVLSALMGSAASSAGTARPRQARQADLGPPRPAPSPERAPETIQLGGLGESDDSAIDVSRPVRAGPPELNALMKNMDVQTAALLQLLSAQQQRPARADADGVRSVLQVKPQISWPVLDDKDNDVDDFIDEFESTVGLANDGLGMADREKLRVLANCLRQSRKQVYKVVTKAARRAGTLESDPGAVYDQVIERLREFREGEIEKQTRVTNQWDALVKGKLSALQFLPQFENCVAEM